MWYGLWHRLEVPTLSLHMIIIVRNRHATLITSWYKIDDVELRFTTLFRRTIWSGCLSIYCVYLISRVHVVITWRLDRRFAVQRSVIIVLGLDMMLVRSSMSNALHFTNMGVRHWRVRTNHNKIVLWCRSGRDRKSRTQTIASLLTVYLLPPMMIGVGFN